MCCFTWEEYERLKAIVEERKKERERLRSSEGEKVKAEEIKENKKKEEKLEPVRA